MTDSFKEIVGELVEKCGGNQAEAAKKAGIAQSLISDTINGRGPLDPRTETWIKVYKALGKSTPLKLKENRAQYMTSDRVDSLADFIRTLPDEKQEIFFSLAKTYGYVENDGKKTALFF